MAVKHSGLLILVMESSARRSLKMRLSNSSLYSTLDVGFPGAEADVGHASRSTE